MTRTKDLGIVTAYGYALSKGYTGTEEEFAELMASYALVAQEAEEHAEESETWAVGTKKGEVDPDHAENNSKYWAEQAHESSENVDNLIGKAGYIQIGITPQGRLQYIKNNVVDLTISLSENGHLMVGGLE